MRQPVNEITNDPIVLRIMEVLKIQKKTEKELIANIGMTEGTFSKWKYNEVKSYRQHLKEIADYLNVQVDYLTGGVEDMINVCSMTEPETRLIQMYRRMGKREKTSIVSIAELFVDSTLFRECANG